MSKLYSFHQIRTSGEFSPSPGSKKQSCEFSPVASDISPMVRPRTDNESAVTVNPTAKQYAKLAKLDHLIMTE